VRRASGWMGSSVRVIVHNERYRGVVHWNTSEWRKDPDTGKRKRVMRPPSEWISHVDESLRIVSDELWDRAQRRTRPAQNDVRLKAGGKPKYLLSGLLRCDVCDSHYTITDATSYGCSSHHDGNTCSNSIRVRRDRIEAVLLGPINLGTCGSGGAATSFIAITPFIFSQLQRASPRLREPRSRASGSLPGTGLRVLVGGLKVAYA
jgi:site-specific DNA recombinase